MRPRLAHHPLVDPLGRVIPGQRYLMVSAIQAPYQRGGYATAILGALFGQMRADGVGSVEVVGASEQPRLDPVQRSHVPTADETSPPEHKPYVRYLVRL